MYVQPNEFELATMKVGDRASFLQQALMQFEITRHTDTHFIVTDRRSQRFVLGGTAKHIQSLLPRMGGML